MMTKNFLCAFLCFLSFSGFLPSSAASTQRTPASPAVADLEGSRLILLKNEAYVHALAEKIREARSEIVMAYFLFKLNGRPGGYPQMLLNELGAAVRRGVRVIVVLERDQKRESGVNRDNQHASEQLKKIGVQVYFDSPKRTTHTKMAVIDARYTFIGSHNLTQSALKYNNELSVLVDSQAVAEKALNYVKGLRR
jgi:phosphatidylserine/phosphatidylglycerophosphate/cardiolipin synthase-like enzyme